MSRAERWVTVLVGAALAIIGLAIFLNWPLIALSFDGQRSGKGFYVASESMWPTLHLDDRIVPRAVAAAEIKRGMVLVIQAPDTARIYRVAGIEGDRVGLRNGVVVLNGRAVETKAAAGTLRLERFPGESRAHRTVDLGTSQGDDAAPVLVTSGKLFLLGDNRDRSADSRFGPDVLGVGLVDRAAVIGAIDIVLRREGSGMTAWPVESL